MAATSDQGFDVLPAHWAVCEEVAADHGQQVDRKNWRLVVPMHLAETREQARADMAYGLLKLVRYFEKLGGEDLAPIRTVEAAIEQWTERGLTLLGRAIIGTPQDAIDRIRALEQQSGGFGAILILAHDCASPARTAQSYELFARQVLPALRDENRGRAESLEWFNKHSKKIVGELKVAIGNVIEEHEAERKKRGRGVAWGDARDLLVGDDPTKG
jgi:limonene 1,2-monooxygenase